MEVVFALLSGLVALFFVASINRMNDNEKRPASTLKNSETDLIYFLNK